MKNDLYPVRIRGGKDGMNPKVIAAVILVLFCLLIVYLKS
jgi:hypothetical protein